MLPGLLGAIFFLTEKKNRKKEFATTGETSISIHPHFRADASDECVFVGLGDKVQHVLDHITRPNERTFS
jgi:hypothetical protein